jgi:hypothetical protein
VRFGESVEGLANVIIDRSQHLLQSFLVSRLRIFSLLSGRLRLLGERCNVCSSVRRG